MLIYVYTSPNILISILRSSVKRNSNKYYILNSGARDVLGKTPNPYDSLWATTEYLLAP